MVERNDSWTRPPGFGDRRWRKPRWRAVLAVVVLHALVAWALVRWLGVAPLIQPAQRAALQAYNVVATPVEPLRKPQQTRHAGASAPAGDQARSSPVVVPSTAPAMPLAMVTAPVASIGEQPRSGAATAGAGSGTGGPGAGTGSGASGNGDGGGAVRKPVQIAGSISSTRDYPPDRDLHRIGLSVTIAFTVRIDGRISDCHVLHPSGDAEADTITCRLALERFRFRPATNAAGDPVESRYGWKQSWFRPSDH